MAHLRCSQLSWNIGLSVTVSTRALIIGAVDRGFLKPQIIGNTVSLPVFEGAMTGTISVGLISPSFFKGLDIAIDILELSEEASAFSIYGMRSVDCWM